MRALLSVYDKTGIASFAGKLADAGWEIVSTGGTARELEAAGLSVIEVSALTNIPEILDGRVKTLHPAIHAGLLARPDREADIRTLCNYGIAPFQLLAVNLYPFVSTIAEPDASLANAIEQIDIGGPAMIRAAAKNHAHVLPLVDPDDYPLALELVASGSVSGEVRRKLAAKAFAHTSAYDAAIAGYLGRESESRFPAVLSFSAQRSHSLRYGENPHQSAAAYRIGDFEGGSGVLGARQLHGKELSYNNLLDADAAWRCVRQATEPTIAIIKHTIPCGMASADSPETAFDRALGGDPVSAFGGIVASNVALDGATAQRIAGHFFEVVVAPKFANDAVELLRGKKQLRLLEITTPASPTDELEFRSVSGGILVQEPDDVFDDEAKWSVASDREVTSQELRDLRFAWMVVRHLKSNAIALVRDRTVVGVGNGQPNRVESVTLAVRKAGERARGCVLASDAFFPFADGIETAAAAGVTAVIQPGGSVRDGEVLSAANAAGMAMIFTGRRHFNH